MRAERLGSYSNASTVASTSRSFRLKSMTRYLRLWPPPMWREVKRPLLLRPPVRLTGSIRDLSGFSFVISSNPGVCLKRWVGVRGLKFFSAMFACPSLYEIDFLALGERHDRLLPMDPPSKISPTFALLLSSVLTSVHSNDFLAENILDRLLDLQFVRTRIDPENVLIIPFAKQASLFRQPNVLNEIRRFVHANLSASLAKASFVTIIFWKASSCSVFTSEAVFKRIG